MNKKTQNELLTAEKLVGFCKIVLKIIVKMVFFAIGSFSVIIGGWCVGLFATFLAAYVSFPVDEILTPVGVYLTMLAIPTSFIFCRICFFSWRLVFAPFSKPFKIGNTISRIFFELAYWLVALMAFICLHTIVAFSYDYSEHVVGLVIAIIFLCLAGLMIIPIHGLVKRLNKEIEIEVKLVSK